MPDGPVPTATPPATPVAALHDLMARFAAIGATAEGGVTRLAASAEDGEARDLLCRWFREQGFAVAVDGVGNIFGCLDFGEAAGTGAIYCGSHIDSQPNGGRFDGTYGVVAACCAALAIRQSVAEGGLIPRVRHLVVAAWTNEEGARFQPSLLGSSVFAGLLEREQALAATDGDGVSLETALRAIGYLGSDAPPTDPEAYVELHVEQGAVLEQADRQVGVVTHCWGARKFQTRFHGRPDHTGPTPMAQRRDALRAASLLIAEVSERALASDGRLHGSVGRIVVAPNSPNVVPQSATLWVELRSGDEAVLDAAEEAFHAALARIAEATGCRAEIERGSRRGAQAFDADGAAAARSALEALDLNVMTMATIAGHDALAIQERYPATLLFVPSVDGVSHSPQEFTEDRDLETGLTALIAVLSHRLTHRPSGARGGASPETGGPA